VLAAGAALLARSRPAQAIETMTHVVLLGDSVFDNGRYVPGEPDVVRQLREQLSQGGRATLLAVDGSTLPDIPRQIAQVPAAATHLIVSIGGNDALRASAVFQEPSRSVGESLVRLAEIRERFHAAYDATAAAVLARGLPAAFCTVYDPRYPDALQRRVGIAGLSLINDGILRTAAARAVPVFDLRLICGNDADFANPIEPSAAGGRKIAGAIAGWVTGPAPRGRAEIINA
jgi:lysophospholipase L1-like esterase